MAPTTEDVKPKRKKIVDSEEETMIPKKTKKTKKIKKEIIVEDDEPEVEETVKPKRKKKKEDIESLDIEVEEIVVPKKKKKDSLVGLVVEDMEDELETKSTKKSKNTRLVLEFNFEIGDVVVNEDLNSLLKMPKFKDATPQQITDILAESPSLQARWNVLYNQAAYEYEQAKINYDVWLANVSEDVRERLTQEGKVTEGKIQNNVYVLPEYVEKNTQVIELKRIMNNVKAAAVAFGSRGDKAVTMAHLLKREMSMNHEARVFEGNNI